MKSKKLPFHYFLVLTILFLNSNLVLAGEQLSGKNAEEKEEAAEKVNGTGHPMKEVVSGVATVGKAPLELAESTVEETKSGPPIVGTLRGIERGAGDLTRSAVKGVSNIVSLGHSQQSELEPPEVGTEHNDPAKFKIRIPGT